jgi:hypothetical protein
MDEVSAKQLVLVAGVVLMAAIVGVVVGRTAGRDGFRTVEATVSKTHVDVSGEDASSNYMVATDASVFESTEALPDTVLGAAR